MRVLGVDPGTVACGWGVVDEVAGRPRFVAGGVFRPRGTLPQRLAALHAGVAALLAEHLPNCVSLEQSFVGANVQSALRLGEARGSILVAAATAAVDVAEYSPAAIKVAVAGNGRAAKEQMQQMVAHILGVAADLPADQADALGAAICHLNSRRFADLVAVEAALGGGRARRGSGRAGRRR